MTGAPGHDIDDRFTYEAVCRWDGKKFTLSLPQIGLEKEAEDFAILHEEMRRGLKELSIAHRKLGLPAPEFLLPKFPDRSAARARGGGNEPRRGTGLMVLVACLAVGLVMAYVAAHHVYTIARGAADPARIARAVSTTLDRAALAASGFTPEREQKMREDIRIIVEKIQPLAQELRPLFTDAPETNPSDGRKR